MPVVGAEAEARVEQALAVAEQHGGDVQLELVEQARGEHLADELAAAGDLHVLVAGGGACQLDGPLEALGDERERRPALRAPGRPGGGA